MNTIRNLTLTCLLGMLFALPAQAQITTSDYKLQKDNISKTHDAEKEKCKGQMGNQRDVCIAEADAKEEIAKADLEAAYKDTSKTHINAAKVKAKANFKVAKERCDDQTGDAKSICVKKAEADRDSALADVGPMKETYKARKDIGKAREEAREEKMDANYELEMKKCDSYAGDAKDSCQTRVKQRFGK